MNTRNRIGYIKKKRDGRFSLFAFKYGTIKHGGGKGIWQFETSYFRGKRVPFIFFTCPHCGEINKDHLSLRGILERVSYGQIRYCHNCRYCRKQVPYTLLNSPVKIRREYDKAAKQA